VTLIFVNNVCIIIICIHIKCPTVSNLPESIYRYRQGSKSDLYNNRYATPRAIRTVSINNTTEWNIRQFSSRPIEFNIFENKTPLYKQVVSCGQHWAYLYTNVEIEGLVPSHLKQNNTQCINVTVLVFIEN